MEDAAIRELVARLSRPHPSGGVVIERAAIMAAGTGSSQIVDWIVEHHGQPEEAVAGASGGGLHGSRMTDGAGSAGRLPLRYVLPAGVLAT